MGPRDRKPRQLGLFGKEASGDDVSPALPEADDAEVARRLPRKIRLGTSSWSFPGWRGLVYDREYSRDRLARHGLRAYGRHPLLRAAGIDRTYYAPLPAETFEDYAAQVPADFRFVVKAHEHCTVPRFPGLPRYGELAGRGNPTFLDAAYAAGEVVGPSIDGLGRRLGALVFQFPPLDPADVGGAGGFADRLHRFLTDLPDGPPYAVEIRNAALFDDRYRQALAAAGATHCVNVHPSMPAVAAQREALQADAGRPLVVRWMLHAGLSYETARSRYEPFDRLVDEDAATREALATLCLKAAASGRPALVIANNKAEGSAPLTVFRLARAIASRIG